VSQPIPDQPKSPRTVLELIAGKTGLASKVLLPDSGSELGASPVVDPGSAASKLVPQGRGNYQLLGEIARGGMGVILKGHDTDLGRDVAVKVLGKDLAGNPAVVQRFIEEAQIGGQLQHPGIVPVYELGLMADDCPYFTMKLVKGRTLAAILQQRKSPTDDRGKLLAIFESVCQTMAYAHSKGVLHRDLKPANIMVGAFGEVQVVDWGLAKVLHRGGVADEKRSKETVHTIIETVRSGPGSSGSDSIVGSVMGTPAYMSPEQAGGEVEKLDERADVFSLGAILCQLLTGRPPYIEEEAAEPVIVQAAHGSLDPARARIEACEADPALKRLCLGCLMPARAARPANADEVARAVHLYLTTTEERAQKAEVAAVEARIKAAEERRARRLTVALAGTVAAAVLLGSGGAYFLNRERAKRVEQTRTAVETAQGEAIEFGRAGKPNEALASARRALALADSGGADQALLDHARSFVAQAEQDLSAAEREKALHEQDETLRKRLIDLRLKQIASVGNAKLERDYDAAFAQAFHDYGVDLEGDDLVPALERIRARAIAEEVALALDDWGRVRRHVHGAKSEKVENLLLLAMDLDPDPVRMRLRQAIQDDDLATLLDLASPDNLPKLAPGSIWALSATLWDQFPEHKPDVFRIYDQVQHLYPNDYVLQAVGGTFYQNAGRWDEAFACRTAALGLRPDDPEARLRKADALYFVGRLTDSEAEYRACVAIAPNNNEAWYGLGSVQFLLGDYPHALASFERTLAIEDNPNFRPDLAVVRFYLGLSTRDEIEHLLANENTPNNFVSYLFALVDHPDPKQRDPQLVLRTLEERAAMIGDTRWSHVVECIARARLGDWPGALAAFENRFLSPLLVVITPNSFDFLRALIYSHLGRDAEAKSYYERGLVLWNERTVDDPAAWQRSDVMRWRREAEAALVK
jgi:serine/threonine-protein kinase